jgi:uncharacterized protein (TIGR03067 family)
MMSARCACLLSIVVVVFAAGRPAGAQDDKKELAELQGTWKLVSAEHDNPALDSDGSGLAPWVIKGNKVLYAGAEWAVLTVDSTTTPRVIDLGPLQPKRVFEGVYVVEGDQLKICVNRQTDGAKNRPLDFTTKGQADRLLLVFERTKAGEALQGAAGFVGMAIRADKNMGVSIGNVLEGSPAEKAGLKKDDVLLKIGGGVPTDLKSAVELVRQVRPGVDLTIRVQRAGKEQDVVVRVGVVPFFPLQ